MLRVGYVVGASPDWISVIDLIDQPHCQERVPGRTALDRSIVDDDISEAGNLLVPGRIVVVPGDLFLWVTTVIVGVGGHDGQGLCPVALGTGEDTAEDDAAPLQIDVEMEPVPPLGG